MHKKSVLVLSTLAITCSLATFSNASATNTDVTVAVNGQVLSFTDVAPQLKNDRTYVPYRAVFETLNATVDFDSATSTVSAQRGDRSVSFVIGSSQVTVTENGQTETLQTDAATYIDLLSNYWANNIQAPMVYRFFADGTVQEYTMEPGAAVTEANLSPSRSISYRFTDGQLILEWGDGFETTLDLVTSHSPVTFDMVSNEIPADSVFFYETSWTDTCIPDNAFYLTQTAVEVPPSDMETALRSHITHADHQISFTVPQEGSWNILISGRLELENFGGMSVHYLENTAWENGKTYSFDLDEGTYTDLTLNAYSGTQEISINLLPFLPKQ